MNIYFSTPLLLVGNGNGWLSKIWNAVSSIPEKISTVVSFITNWRENVNDMLVSWVSDICESILSAFAESFNNTVTDISDLITQYATDVGSGSSAVVTLVRNVSQNVILPIAGLVLGIALSYELIQMFMAKNEYRTVDVTSIFKWIVKACVGVVVVSNSWSIVRAVFALGSWVITGTTAQITNITPQSGDMSGFTVDIASINLTALTGLGQIIVFAVLCAVCWIVFSIMSVLALIYIQIWYITTLLYIAVSPLMFATIVNGEVGMIGKNYFKSLAALAFQGFFMILMFGIFVALFNSATSTGSPNLTVLYTTGYGILLVFMLRKSGQLAKSIFDAH